MDTSDPNTERQKEIFNEALALGSEEARRQYLQAACGADEGLRAQVAALLRAHAEAEGFLATRLAEATGGGSGPAESGAGGMIGRYKLLQKIGEGGCGVVYMAEQTEPVRRRVALKVIKLGMDTKQVIARFEAERQALALMDHPNIAKVFDAGATASGRPYFVMELVRGAKITEFCDQHRLNMADRLKLFVQICQAVEHAHHKGIIHRDIKPSNILVTVNDGEPVPKVIDFGIAKATTGQQLTDKTLFTAYEQFIGTPAYMSPEQAVMTSVEVDARSDVYALGVLLYELLTGTTPFDAKQLLTAGLDEIRRTIREVEPLRPSTRVRAFSDVALTTTARVRGSQPDRLIHLIRGELDWIVMKALEKDRARRYQAATELAADLRRHLSHQPVIARPPSTAYRLRKFFVRNRVPLAFGGLVAALLLGATLIAGWQAAQARRAEQKALEQARMAQAAREYITTQLPRLLQVRLGEEARTSAPPNRAAAPFLRRILDNDGSVADVPAEVVDAYLALNRTNAESLLAAQRTSQRSTNFLRAVAHAHPDHPQVLFTTVTLDVFPEARREWIERYKMAARDALPLYLSARDYLKRGQIEPALQELRAAAARPDLNDYAAERIQALEEVYLQEGRSPAEAKAVATCGLILPHVALCRDLGNELTLLAQRYQAQGDAGSAAAMAQHGVALGRRLSVGSGAGFLINQKVGLGIERNALEQFDPDQALDWLGSTPAGRGAQIEAELAALERTRAQSDHWLAMASDAELVAYFDRVKLYGEPAAAHWIEQRSNGVIPPDNPAPVRDVTAPE